MNIRRLAAVDMHGSSGSRPRRRLVLAEFVVAAIGGVALGGWVLAGLAGAGGVIFGIWLLGTGLNYVPLAAYAMILTRPGALEAELTDADVSQELRYYTVRLFWLFVPLAVVLMAVRRNGPA
jgi:hypothetical protein